MICNLIAIGGNAYEIWRKTERTEKKAEVTPR